MAWGRPSTATLRNNVTVSCFLVEYFNIPLKGVGNFRWRDLRILEHGSWRVAVLGHPAEGAGQGRPPGTNTCSSVCSPKAPIGLMEQQPTETRRK